MNEVLFRGKLESNGNWVEGYYTEIPIPSLGATIFDGSGESVICEDTESCIISITSGQHPNYSSAIPLQVVECEKYVVDPKTVGKYTNLKDKNGDKIFTGHIVTIFGIKYTVVFECGSFGLATSSFIEYKPFEERIFEITGCNNKPRYTYNDNFIPLWEIYWNFNCEDNIINLIEIIGNIHEEELR